MPNLRVLATDLEFPEGPIAMEDGSVILVEIARGTLNAVLEGRREIVANMAAGRTGRPLVRTARLCQQQWRLRAGRRENGAILDPGGRPRLQRRPVERVDSKTGKVERARRGWRLSPCGPNDLVFDTGRRLLVHRSRQAPPARHRRGAVYYAMPDGSKVISRSPSRCDAQRHRPVARREDRLRRRDPTSRLWAFDIVGPGQIELAAVSGPPAAGRAAPGRGYQRSTAWRSRPRQHLRRDAITAASPSSPRRASCRARGDPDSPSPTSASAGPTCRRRASRCPTGDNSQPCLGRGRGCR